MQIVTQHIEQRRFGIAEINAVALSVHAKDQSAHLLPIRRRYDGISVGSRDGTERGC
jgi:hypothetical protein